MKKVILIGSHAGMSTGYSKVVYNLLVQLDKYDDIKVYSYGIQRPNQLPDVRPLNFKNVVLYDAMANEKTTSDGFGMYEIKDYVSSIQPDIVMIYNDVYTTHHYIEQIKHLKSTLKFKIVCYYDMFYKNFYTKFIPNIEENADLLFVFSEYWRNFLKDELKLQVPVKVLRHGFDKNTFYPKDTAICRKNLGIPADAFVILNLNRNLTRKRIDIFMAAYAKLLANNPTTQIYCVQNSNKEYGFDVFGILAHELRECGQTPEQIDAHVGKLVINNKSLPDEMINDLYNAADIGVNTCEGEGFGLTNFEHSGVGKPQVISNVGGLSDIFDNSYSIKIDPVASLYLDGSRDGIGGKAQICDPQQFYEGMEFYLKNPSIRKLHGTKAMAEILTEKYSWERIGRQLHVQLMCL